MFKSIRKKERDMLESNIEDLSNRELERFLLRKIMQENFFAAFLYQKIHRITSISHLRAKIVTKRSIFFRNVIKLAK